MLTLAEPAPDQGQLGVGQQAIAPAIFNRLVGVGRRVGIDVTLSRAPREERRQAAADPVGRGRAARLGDLGQARRDGATVQRGDGQGVQRLAVPVQVPVGFRVGARLHPGALSLQKRRQQGTDRLASLDASDPLLVRWVTAQADARQHVLGGAAGLADVELGDRAEPQLPGALGNGVLHPPASVTAAPQPQPEARQVVVEKYLVADARRQRQAGND